ncbi:hypothetical protein OPV22_019106 [Ensete ventricosum]|uniref:Uncharacterized protein n=1 Tax=Ensete ventricosum TaxID=4639 RepID=A0AAV8PJY8_ENSVE|nr:hypothetical protein OPV22_019106 [Ensete ventricosum]
MKGKGLKNWDNHHSSIISSAREREGLTNPLKRSITALLVEPPRWSGPRGSGEAGSHHEKDETISNNGHHRPDHNQTRGSQGLLSHMQPPRRSLQKGVVE